MSTAIAALHDALEARWEAAGSPAAATELCLWDMERIIDGLDRQHPQNDALVEGVELLEAWIEIGEPANETEIATIRAAKTQAAESSLRRRRFACEARDTGLAG